MTELLTGETIKSAMARKIHSFFTVEGATPTIYKELVLQNFVKPSFFIWTLHVTPTKLMNNNYIFNYQMNVRYHPTQSDPKMYEHLCDVGIKLLECLSRIDVPMYEAAEPLPVTGKQMSYEITDDVLQVYVSYDIKVRIGQESGVAMGNLTINEK